MQFLAHEERTIEFIIFISEPNAKYIVEKPSAGLSPS